MSEITVCLIIAVITMILFIGRVFPMALTSVLILMMEMSLPNLPASWMQRKVYRRHRNGNRPLPLELCSFASWDLSCVGLLRLISI